MVFVSLTVNNYYYTIATADFLEGAPYNLTGAGGYSGWVLPSVGYVSYSDTVKMNRFYEYYDQIQNNASAWERLSNQDCIQAYSNAFLTGRRNLILVSSTKNATNSVLRWDVSEISQGDLDLNWWICSKTQDGGNIQCQPDDYVSKADDWSVWGFPIDYCLSETVQDVCDVEFSLDIMVVVIVFNLIKVLAMMWVLLRYNAEEILATVGDSVASFMRKEDVTTTGMCLAGWRDISYCWQYSGNGRAYQPRCHRRAAAVSKGKWWLFSLLMLLSFAFIAIFGGWGFSHTKSRGNSLSLSSLWQMGFGAAHQDAIVIYDRVDSLVGMAFLANIPQIFLAAVWLLYMGIMTSMFLAVDWSVFGTKGQSLMVNNARGDQRGTWLLGAPIIWGIPLLLLQIVLHWLVSMSIFVISLNIYDPDGTPSQGRSYFRNCGYSPIAIIFTIITMVLLILSAIAMASRRLAGEAPIVSTCSAAISAACHLPNGLLRYDSLYKPMKWGQCGQPQYGVGHCALMPEDSFKSGYASPPMLGWMYI